MPLLPTSTVIVRVVLFTKVVPPIISGTIPLPFSNDTTAVSSNPEPVMIISVPVVPFGISFGETFSIVIEDGSLTVIVVVWESCSPLSSVTVSVTSKVPVFEYV